MAVPAKLRRLVAALVPHRRRAHDARRRATYRTGAENPDNSRPYSHARATAPLPPSANSFGGF